MIETPTATRTTRRSATRLMHPRYWSLALALATLSGCVSVGPTPSPVTGAPGFDPLGFFTGSTHGTGTLHVVLHQRRTTDVAGEGSIDAQGGLTLRQRVTIGNAAPTNRVWHLRRAGPHRYTGTLSDASGPVVASVSGSALTIRFPMKHGLSVVQQLYLQPDGRVALNTMVVRKWGIVVARLTERIEKRP